jgi:ABC-type uncharacterized transport system auxiliary subunit
MRPLHALRGRRAALYLLLVLSLVATGCAGSRPMPPEVRYYTLSYDPPVLSLPPAAAILSVQPLTVSPEYDTGRMVYQEREYALSEYAYHRWRSAPSQLVTALLTRDLRSSTLFRGVVSADSIVPATHLIEGNVDEFLERDEQDQWYAVLGISISLLEVDRSLPGEMVLFQKSYRTRAPSKVQHPRGLAAAMSEAMAVLSRQISVDIHAELAD